MLIDRSVLHVDGSFFSSVGVEEELDESIASAQGIPSLPLLTTPCKTSDVQATNNLIINKTARQLTLGVHRWKLSSGGRCMLQRFAAAGHLVETVNATSA